MPVIVFEAPEGATSDQVRLLFWISPGRLVGGLKRRENTSFEARGLAQREHV